MACSPELVGKVGETEGGEGGAEHPRLLEGEGIGVAQGVHTGVPSGEAGVGVVTGLVIVVLDVQVTQLGVLDPQRAAVVVNVLAVQGELGCLGGDHVWILYQRLKMWRLRQALYDYCDS